MNRPWKVSYYDQYGTFKVRAFSTKVRAEAFIGQLRMRYPTDRPRSVARLTYRAARSRGVA